MKLFYWVQRGSLLGTIHPRSNWKYSKVSTRKQKFTWCITQLPPVDSSNEDKPDPSADRAPEGGMKRWCGWWLMEQHAERRRRRFAHLGSQLLHVRVDLIQQVVALLEQRVLGVHEGQHLDGTGAFCLLTVQMFVRGIYHKDDTEDDARVCASAGTHSIEDLKFLLGLEDVDLQRTRTNVFYSFIHIWFILLL